MNKDREEFDNQYRKQKRRNHLEKQSWDKSQIPEDEKFRNKAKKEFKNKRLEYEEDEWEYWKEEYR